MTVPYKNCPKCGVRHSTLVKHRCFKPEEQKEKPEFDDPPPGEGGEDGGSGGQPEEKDGQGEREGQGESQGEGEQEGEGEGQGEGEGEGEDEDEQKGEGEGPEPQMPEPETPPVAVVCTVLKFAALTAQCATALIEVRLKEDGLEVYGHNGEAYGFRIIPWGEFEKRSTLDGEFYVKEVIDELDEELSGEVIEGEATEIEPDNDGWIEWEPGEQPLPDGVEVEFILRDGSGDRWFSQMLDWTELGGQTIVRYRIT